MEKRSRSPKPVQQATSTDAAVATAQLPPPSTEADAEPLAKKIKMDDQQAAEPDAPSADIIEATANMTPEQSAVSAAGVQLGHMTEERAGMTQYINPSLPAFDGIIKQRFTDFMVNEITLGPERTVCRITSLDPPPGKLLQDLKRARGELDEKEVKRQQEEAEKKRQQAEADSLNTAWPEDADEKLSPYFTSEALAELRTMWEQGSTPPAPAARETIEVDGAKPDEASTAAAESAAGRQGGRKVSAVQDNRRVLSRPLASKAERTQSHAVVRDLFHGKLATESVSPASDKQEDDDEDARANAAAAGDASAATTSEPLLAVLVKWARRSDRRTKDLFDEEALSSPPYIHFLLQKTNRDNEEAMVLLAQALGLTGGPHGHRGKSGSGTKDLSVAGTKDKRAVTVQRVALKRGRKTLAEVWKALNAIDDGGRGGGDRGGRGGRGRGGGFGNSNFGRGKTLLQAVENRGDRGLRVAHLHYASEPLKLGQLSGNEFTVTLRNVKAPNDNESIIHAAMETIRQKGFINYYGMQRFGTGSVPTHEFGILIFKGDYKGAVELLFEERDNDMDDLREAKRFYREGKLDDAFHTMPRSCVAEKAVLDKMRRRNFTKGDYLGAFGNIPRTLRLMYIHAYQSYIWNRLVSERIRRFGPDKPAVGDVVMLGGDADEIGDVDADAEVDADADGEGEGETKPDADAVAPSTSEETPAWKRPVKVLRDSDVSSNAFPIHSVVVPLPGIDIALPVGWMSEMYAQLLSESGLKASDLTDSKQEEYRLRGSYRKMIQRATDFNYKLVRYTDPDVALTVADEDKCLGLKHEGSEPTTTLADEDKTETIDEVKAVSTDEVKTETMPVDPPVEVVTDGTPQDVGEAAQEARPAPFLALLLNFKLPSSAYATMLMREGLKSDTSSFKHRLMTQASEDQAFKGRQGGGRGARGRGDGRGRGGGRGGRGGRGGGGGGGGGHGQRGVNNITSQKVRSWGGGSAA